MDTIQYTFSFEHAIAHWREIVAIVVVCIPLVVMVLIKLRGWELAGQKKEEDSDD